MRLRHGGHENDRFAETDGAGVFVVRGLGEGDYEVAADVPAATAERRDWRDCGVLRAGANSVDLRMTR